MKNIIFKFHSGYITTINENTIKHFEQIFKFHSGYITTYAIELFFYYGTTLNSTLVILLPQTANPIATPVPTLNSTLVILLQSWNIPLKLRSFL